MNIPKTNQLKFETWTCSKKLRHFSVTGNEVSIASFNIGKPEGAFLYSILIHDIATAGGEVLDLDTGKYLVGTLDLLIDKSE